ncbi:MAG: class I SAM-dependent methyltransferase [Bacteriovoracia bacterium]
MLLQRLLVLSFCIKSCLALADVSTPESLRVATKKLEAFEQQTHLLEKAKRLTPDICTMVLAVQNGLSNGIDYYSPKDWIIYAPALALLLEEKSLSGKKILTVASGYGLFSKYLRSVEKSEATSLDITPRNITIGKTLGVENHILSDAAHISVADGQYDYVMTEPGFLDTNLFLTTEDALQTLQEIYRVLSSDGKLILPSTDLTFIPDQLVQAAGFKRIGSIETKHRHIYAEAFVKK